MNLVEDAPELKAKVEYWTKYCEAVDKLSKELESKTMTKSREELLANIDEARAKYLTCNDKAFKEYYEALDKLSKELKENDNENRTI